MYNMCLFIHVCSYAWCVPRNPVGTPPQPGTQDTMTFYKWEWPGSNKKFRNLAQIASWLERCWVCFPKSITISPFWWKRFEWVSGDSQGFMIKTTRNVKDDLVSYWRSRVPMTHCNRRIRTEPLVQQLLLGALSPPEPVEEKNLLNIVYIFFWNSFQTSGSNFVLFQTTMNEMLSDCANLTVSVTVDCPLQWPGVWGKPYLDDQLYWVPTGLQANKWEIYQNLDEI